VEGKKQSRAESLLPEVLPDITALLNEAPDLMNVSPNVENQQSVSPNVDYPIAGNPIAGNQQLLNTDTTKDLVRLNKEFNAEKITEPPQKPPENRIPSTASAVELGEPITALVPASQGPPPAPKTSRKLELTPEQLQLFRVAKTCFESSEKSRALMCQDKGSTAMEMRSLKTLAIRCSNMAPGISAGFMRNVLEHFRVMTNGRLRGKAVFAPRSLVTPWVWELVIDSLPESEATPDLRESIRGLFR
jgi:hypothetical protein